MKNNTNTNTAATTNTTPAETAPAAIQTAPAEAAEPTTKTKKGRKNNMRKNAEKPAETTNTAPATAPATAPETAEPAPQDPQKTPADSAPATIETPDTNPAETKDASYKMNYVVNAIFPDTQLTREALAYRATFLEAVDLAARIKTAKKELEIKDGKPAKKMTTKERAAKKETLEQMESDLKKLHDLYKPLEGSYNVLVGTATAAGNTPATVSFILSLVATANNTGLRKHFTKNLFGSDSNSTAASLAAILNGTIRKTDAEDVYTFDATGARKALETLVKTAFSMPFESAANNKFRVKITADDARIFALSYFRGTADNVTQNGDKITINPYTVKKGITTRKDKDGNTVYNAAPMISEFCKMILSKVGAVEE